MTGMEDGDPAGPAGTGDTSRWTIHRIEKGMYLPKVALLGRLAGVLDRRIEELLIPG